jgi:hypothetical protein
MQPAQQLIEKANAASLEKLKTTALSVHRDKIQRIKDFAALQPDHPFTLANRHVLELTTESDTTWNGAGILSVSGFVWWALNLTVDLAPPHYVTFNATGGPDWSIALFTSSVFGYFLTDPSRLDGEYEFQLQSIAGVAGEASIDLYKKDGTQIATFVGVVLGVSLSKMSGEGDLDYH